MRLLQVSQTGPRTPTNYHLRKHLVACLALSCLDFNDIIFYPINDCLLKRLQRIQLAAASFDVLGHYVNNIDSILKLGWLPMKEQRMACSKGRAQSYYTVPPKNNARARTSFCVRKPATSCGFLGVACAWILRRKNFFVVRG